MTAEHAVLLYSLFPPPPSIPHLLLGLTSGGSKFPSSVTLLPPPQSLGASQHTLPGTLPPTPRELIKSFLLINSVVSLRGILEDKISHQAQNEVFPMRCLGCSYKMPPGGHLPALQDAWSRLGLQLLHAQLRRTPGTSLWKEVDL